MDKEVKRVNYMSVREFLEIVPISKPHVYRLITNNEIPHLKFGRKVVIHPDALLMTQMTPQDDVFIKQLDLCISNMQRDIDKLNNILSAIKSVA